MLCISHKLGTAGLVVLRSQGFALERGSEGSRHSPFEMPPVFSLLPACFGCLFFAFEGSLEPNPRHVAEYCIDCLGTYVLGL